MQENKNIEDKFSYVKNKLEEIDSINDQNYENIVNLFHVVTQVDKQSRAQIRQEIKTLQGLVIGCFAVAFLFLTNGSIANNQDNVDRIADSVTNSLINNMDKVIALGISLIGGYKVFTAGKQAEQEEEDITCNVLDNNNITNQTRVLRAGNVTRCDVEGEEN